MKPTITILEKYGDHRDAKSAPYDYKLDFKPILYNLTDEDAAFILAIQYKNILWGEDIAEGKDPQIIHSYNIAERGSEVLVHIIMQNTNTLKQTSFFITYCTQTKLLDFRLDSYRSPNASEVIMFYEYFLNK